MRRVGVFGGTFDPIHNGHFHLVCEMKKHLSLDLIIVVVANLSPFKVQYPPRAGASERLEMARMAFSGLQGVEVSSLEVDRKGVSYTIDTVKEILKLYPHDEIFLLLTQDALETFKNWKNSRELEGLVKVIFAVDQNDNKIASQTYQLCPIPWIKCSSTQVRNRFLEKKDCSQFLSPKVLDYITKHQLYFKAYGNG